MREALVPTKYFEKTTETLYGANKQQLNIQYKLTNAKVCNDGVCYNTSFLMVKNLSQNVILGLPFIHLISPFKVTSEGLISEYLGKEILFPFTFPILVRDLNTLKNKSVFLENQIANINIKQDYLSFLKNDLHFERQEKHLEDPKLQQKIQTFKRKLESEVCASFPNAFWNRKRHIVSLPYNKEFSERGIPTKVRPIQMSSSLLEHCKKEIADLLQKGLIRPSKSPWSCPAFYVQKNAEIERGVPRLVINYKSLNDALQWIRYPIPNKSDLLKRLYNSNIFSKFDMKSGFWQIQIDEKDRYKTAFTVPFGQYKWNVMPFGLKNAPSEFQSIMNEIFNPYTEFSIVYIDDVLIYSDNIDQHWKHLDIFLQTAKHQGLVVSAPKIVLYQTKIRFLGHNIERGTILPIQRSLEFADKFPDVIKDKTQLQRFLGCLNYIANFCQQLRIICKPLFQRLKKNPAPWTEEHTLAVKKIKAQVKSLQCLVICHPTAPKIVETDASELGYGGILKQVINNQECLVRYVSGVWNDTQQKYSTVKKEILAIVLTIQKFQDDLINQKFVLKVDC
ncbi:hypothetical protein LWI29_035373 [Acer saccharum]|uniref:Reverse transcriptase domain-containing protein n=1 Tax=Acer saccharum TaxID=4024 RepID=A0AA39T7R1_ACESA|nr:hypothetical protein LWI29_035373 [Acer saccharum]